MWDLIVSVPDHYLSFYFIPSRESWFRSVFHDMVLYLIGTLTLYLHRV